MASLQTLERRIAAMHRAVVGVQIGQSRLLAHLGLHNVTNEEIDQALDDEAGT